MPNHFINGCRQTAAGAAVPSNKPRHRAKRRYAESGRAATQRSRVTRQFERLHAQQFVTLKPQHGHVLVVEIADIDIISLWTERYTFRQPTELCFSDFAHLLALDLEQDGDRMLVVEKGRLRRTAARSIGQDRHSVTAGRPHRQSFRSIANHHLIDDAWRVQFQVNKPNLVYLAISDSRGVTSVVDQGEFSIGRNLNVVGKDARRHIVALVGHLGSIDIEKSYAVCQCLSYQRVFAVGRYCDGGW